MKKRNFGKKLVALVAAAVMVLGCFSTVAAYTPTKKDKSALKVGSYIFSVPDDDGDYDEVKPVILTMTDDLAAKLGSFYAQYPTGDIHMLFKLKKSDVDEDDGTKLQIADSGVTDKSKQTVFQYDDDEGVWKKLSASKRTGFIKFTVKKTTPILITDNEPKKQSVSKLTLSTKKLSLEVGEKAQLEVTAISPSSFLDFKQKWESSDKSIATVSKTGLVTAKKRGQCKVSLSVGGKSVSCTVNVIKKVKKITLKAKGYTAQDDGVYEVPANKSITIKLTLSPSKPSDRTIKWEIVGSRGKSIAKLFDKRDQSCGFKLSKSAKQTDVVKVRATAKDGSGVKQVIKFRILPEN